MIRSSRAIKYNVTLRHINCCSMPSRLWLIRALVRCQRLNVYGLLAFNITRNLLCAYTNSHDISCGLLGLHILCRVLWALWSVIVARLYLCRIHHSDRLASIVYNSSFKVQCKPYDSWQWHRIAYVSTVPPFVFIGLHKHIQYLHRPRHHPWPRSTCIGFDTYKSGNTRLLKQWLMGSSKTYQYCG